MSVTVVCVLKSGGVYNPEWVYKLASGVKQNLSRPYDFVCLSDQTISGVDVVPLVNHWPGWWSKLEIFRPRLFTGSVLYIDLDSIVVGPLDNLFSQTVLYMCEDFTFDGFNSSVMSWNSYFFSPYSLYEYFASDPGSLMKFYDRNVRGRVGDQAYIEDRTRPRCFPPGKIVSYKKSKGAMPKSSTSIVAFHGKPKPNQTGDWAQRAWEAL